MLLSREIKFMSFHLLSFPSEFREPWCVLAADVIESKFKISAKKFSLFAIFMWKTFKFYLPDWNNEVGQFSFGNSGGLETMAPIGP